MSYTVFPSGLTHTNPRRPIFLMSLALLVGCQPAEEAASDAATEDAASADAVTDPTVSAPANYKVEFENDHVRAVRITYAAGEETECTRIPPRCRSF